MKDYFDPDTLRSIDTLSRDDALHVCLEMLNKTGTKASKKQHLIKDITEAPDAKEMSRIMYNTMLSGMGLATTNSSWQKLHG